MVVLWIVLKYLGLLLVFESPDKVINAEIFSPFFAVNEPVLLSASVEAPIGGCGSSHLLRLFYIEFPSAKEP